LLARNHKDPTNKTAKIKAGIAKLLFELTAYVSYKQTKKISKLIIHKIQKSIGDIFVLN